MGRCCGCAESISRWPAVRPRSATETSWNRSPPNRPSRNQKQHNPTGRQLRNRVRSFGMNSPSRAQLGTISVGPDSQSTWTKVCRIGRGAQLGVISVSRGPSQLAPRPVELGTGPNWEQFRSAQVPSQLAPRSVELSMGNSCSRPRFPVNLHQGL